MSNFSQTYVLFREAADVNGYLAPCQPPADRLGGGSGSSKEHVSMERNRPRRLGPAIKLTEIDLSILRSADNLSSDNEGETLVLFLRS